MSRYYVKSAERILEHITFVRYVIGCLARDAELMPSETMKTHLGHLYNILGDTVMPKIEELITLLREAEG